MKNSPRIFISYSWTSPRHEKWVQHLAEELVTNGIEVVFDKWDLKEGQDKYHFMESNVKSDDIDKVLLILDKGYVEKADKRTGGVGTETQIISPEIYDDVQQGKFIPIVCERDENGKEFLPTFLKSRIYIDMSNDKMYHESYEQLLRNLFNRPAVKKPKLGKAPDYLFQDDPKSIRYRTILNKLKFAINNKPERVDGELTDFCEEYYNNLYNDYLLDAKASSWYEAGKEIVENLTSQLTLKDEFIIFFDTLLKSKSSFDIDIVIRFLERLPLLTEFRENQNSSKSHEFDNYRFIIHELFLSLIAIGLKHEQYTFVGELFHSSYFIESRYQTEIKSSTYNKFNYNIDKSLNEYYRQTKNQNFHSTTADLLIERIPQLIPKDFFIYADLLCFYVSSLCLDDGDFNFWFPRTYIYKDNGNYSFFDRFISKRHFEKVKSIFDIDSVEEFKLLVQIHIDKGVKYPSYQMARRDVKAINKIIDMENIASSR